MIKLLRTISSGDRGVNGFFRKTDSKRSRTISELLEIWVDGSKGLELLRFRHNKLKGKGELPADIKMLKA